MPFEHYIESGGKRLRCGFTTGTCAALAASAAATLLLTGVEPETVRLITPKGLPVEVAPQEYRLSDGTASCAVQKDAGDDIDATAGTLVFAQVARSDTPGITIDGGVGVGRVTKPGLDQPIGAAAINHVPRRMIAQAVEEVCRAADYHGGISVTISIPEGEAIAARTFNPVLGIVGGISVIGTSGIVEPMSIQALIDTKKLELSQAVCQNPDRVVLTPGNYGLDFLREHPIAGADGIPVVVCSNFIGELLDACAVHELKQVLLVGHVGKLVKLAGGIMNTHSRWGDCRTELICAHAAACGADTALCRELMAAATTDACIDLLRQADLWDAVCTSLLAAMERHLIRRAAGRYEIGAVMFSNEYGELGRTQGAERLLAQWRAENKR
jgi:cobalt-precorrin-5B (C1)-methyltransferase